MSSYDTLSHEHLRSFLDQRVRDGVIRRTIGKWLNAGVMEAGAVWYPEEGSPQGSVVSPVLSNVYLHETLDCWFEKEVKPRLTGRAFLVRYADDAALGFEHEEDAQRVMAVLAKRFGRYGLTLHPQKTRLVDFRAPWRLKSVAGERKTAGRSFDMLGFTHFWARSRKGHWVVMRKTAAKRFRRAVKRVAQWCRQAMHWSLAEQQAALNQKLQGHYGYYGITGNGRALSCFAYIIKQLWHASLSRRSRSRHFSWFRFNALLQRYPLLPPRVVHSVYRAANP
jgi:hypothetical protein